MKRVTISIALSLFTWSALKAQVNPTNEWVSFWSDSSYIGNQGVRAGSVIRAYDAQGIRCGEFVVASTGKYGLMPVYRDDSTTPSVDEGASPGDTIRFTVNDKPATFLGSAVPVWTMNGDVKKLNLLVDVRASVNPASLDFGSVVVGQPSDREVTITNLSSSMDSLTGIVSISGSDFLMPGGGGAFSLAAGQTRIVTVRFMPSVVGSSTGTLSITHNAANQSSPITVALMGNGQSTPPATPTLLSPLDGATGVSTAPTLSWYNSSGATTYHLQVSTNSTFANTLLDQVSVTGASYSIDGLANGTSYYWRVRAINAGGTSAWSDIWNFRTIVAVPSAPILASPGNQAVGIVAHPNLIWNAVSSAVSYRLQVSTVSSFITTLFDQSGVTDTSFSVTGLLNNTNYYWRVNATNAGGTSAWSSVWSFTTIVAVPSAPLLVSPEDGAASLPSNLRLIWYASDGAASYRLQVSIVASFVTTLVDANDITDTSSALSGLATSTTHYWRVSATNAGGSSGWSSTWRFTTAIPSAVGELDEKIPTEYHLYQNYPNPFNPQTTIQFSLPRRGHVRLAVIDMLGREVEQLLNGELNQGVYSVVYTSERISGGVYLYRLQIGFSCLQRKMIVIK